MAGLTLEHATNGRVPAALHRIRRTGDSPRYSLVGKIRAPSDAVLDMDWALRDSTHTGAGSKRAYNSIRVRDIARNTCSVNRSTRAPPAVPARLISLLPKRTRKKQPRGLPAHCISRVISMLKSKDIVRYGMSCSAVHIIAFSDGLWIKKCMRAGLDWSSLRHCDAGKLHQQLAPRMSVWDTNSRVSLRLSICSYENPDGYPTSWPPKKFTTVRIDQRTPLRAVTQPFLDEFEKKLKQIHNETQRLQHGDDETEWDYFYLRKLFCIQGPVSIKGYNSTNFKYGRPQMVNINKTAWHYGFQSGTYLSFAHQNIMSD
jgi:hypothetical protein